MANMCTQFGGITGKIVGFAGVIGQRVAPGRTIQAAFNAVFATLGGRGGCLAAGRRGGAGVWSL
jgi:hypothetical protein